VRAFVSHPSRVIARAGVVHQCGKRLVVVALRSQRQCARGKGQHPSRVIAPAGGGHPEPTVGTVG
jgi:hypothetical protein